MTAELQQDARQVSGPSKGRLRSFFKNRQGATVIEFALLAFPFSLLIFAILESCISFAAQEYLQNTTDDFAREFRTGRIRQNTYTKETFRTKFCDELEVFVSAGCPELTIDLQNFTTFEQAAALRTTVNADGKIVFPSGDSQYKPGLSQSINTLRVFYRWPVITDLMRSRMSNLGDRYTLLFGTATWRNEPFDDQ